MNLAFATATAADAAALARLQTSANRHLLARHGRDAAKCLVTEATVLNGMKNARVLAALCAGEIIGMACLAKKKPWAIDPAYFTPVSRPLYLTNMAVAPDWQRQGVGRQLLDHARSVARAWPGDALRLDAYDNETGAGGFYEKCGFREVARVTYRNTPLIYYELVLPARRETAVIPAPPPKKASPSPPADSIPRPA